MKNINSIYCITTALLIGCEHKNPANIRQRIKGEWRRDKAPNDSTIIIGEYSKMPQPDFVVWNHYTTYYSEFNKTRDTLEMRQGCMHYRMPISYYPQGDSLMIGLFGKMSRVIGSRYNSPVNKN